MPSANGRHDAGRPGALLRQGLGGGGDDRPVASYRSGLGITCPGSLYSGTSVTKGQPPAVRALAPVGGLFKPAHRLRAPTQGRRGPTQRSSVAYTTELADEPEV